MPESGNELVVRPQDTPMAVAVADLHSRAFLPLVRLARTLVDHEASAEEVVQEAFEGVIRRWSSLRDEQAVDSYLRRAIRRLLTPRDSATVPSAEDSALLSDEQKRLLAAVRRLPARQRDVLLLRYFAEWSEAEIADALNVSKGTVKSSAHKGLAALRAALTDGSWVQ